MNPGVPIWSQQIISHTDIKEVEKRSDKMLNTQYTYMYSKTCLKRLLKKKTKIGFQDRLLLKAAYSATMNIFRKKYFLFKSFVKVEKSYVVTTNLISTAENSMEK